MPLDPYTETYLSFREMMVSRRREAGLTQSEVARRVSKPQSFVSKYETGERRLDVVEFVEVAGAIGFDPAEFLRTFALKLMREA